MNPKDSNSCDNVIAIDGLAGVGKSTTARQVANVLDMELLDTGALYRALTLAVLQAELINQPMKWAKLLQTVSISNKSGVTCLDGQDVSRDIRSQEVTDHVSSVSADRQVRAHLLDLQRSALDSQKGLVAEGRDMGSTVFPDAVLKIFLTASPETRGARRSSDRLSAVDKSEEDVVADLLERDTADSQREASPLRKTEDAIEIDSSNLTIDEVVERVVNLYKEVT